MAEEFAAAPKVVKPKPKYKEEPEEEEDEIKLIYNNLMWDKRIVRGNTYAAIVTSKHNEIPAANLSTQNYNRPSQDITDAYDGANKRANIEIFTDEFVETLTDKPPHYEYASQTEPLPDKKVIRHRIGVKIGKDIETQIWDDQLFDFDYEVQSLLNVLCGRTLEIGRTEVLQEEELRIMANRQQELRLAEKQQAKKIAALYDEERRKEQENLKILQNYKKQKEQKIKTHKKLFSRVLAKQFLRDVKKNTLNLIEGNGFFRNPIEIRLTNEVMPKYYSQTVLINQQNEKIEHEALEILKLAKVQLLKEHAWAKEVERTRRQKIIDKRLELQREKQERKNMKEQELLMVRFIADEKAYLEKEEELKRLEELKAEGEAEVPAEN